MNPKQKTIRFHRKVVKTGKESKLLGSLLDTELDIKRRKGQAMNPTAEKDENTSNKISLSSKIRVFNAYVTSIFLYNNEL